MEQLESWLSILRNFWYLEVGIIGVALALYKGWNNSKQNRIDIERHELEIKEIQKGLNHLNESYSKQETQIEQLFEISKEIKEGVREIINKLISR